MPGLTSTHANQVFPNAIWIGTVMLLLPVFFLLIPEGELVTPDLFPVLTQCYEDKSGYAVLGYDGYQ